MALCFCIHLLNCSHEQLLAYTFFPVVFFLHNTFSLSFVSTHIYIPFKAHKLSFFLPWSKMCGS